MSRLARIVDPEALERLEGTRGKMRIEVPVAWAGASVRIAAPRQLQCASCDGGGCDRCQRSGALRPPAEGSIDVLLPREIGEGILVRVVHPFGADGAPEVLLIEVLPGGVAAACVLVAIDPASAPAPQPRAPTNLLGLVALALALLVLVLVLSLR